MFDFGFRFLFGSLVVLSFHSAFISPELNQRTDAYGGSFENRTKIIFDLIDGIRAVTRPDFQLGLRISPERFGLQLGEQIELCKRAMATGKLDYIDLSLWDPNMLPTDPEYASKPLIAWFADLPRNGCRLGAAGKLYSAELCRKVLEYGLDFVVPGRGSILHHDLPLLIENDPEWKAIDTPAPVAHLEKEGISPIFINYLRAWFKGFVEEEKEEEKKESA